MAVISYGLDGAESISFVVDSAPDFRPLEGTAGSLDASFFWRMLPDDFEELLPEDKEFIEASWRGILMYAAAALSEVAHLDQTSSLLDFPVRAPRKWTKIDFSITEDVSGGSPLLKSTLPGKKGARLLQSPQATLETVMETAQDASHTGAYVELRHSMSEKCRGRAVFRGALAAPFLRDQDPTLTSPPEPVTSPEGWVLFGYGDLSKGYLAPGAYAAISTKGRVAAVLVKSDRTATWAVSADSLDVNTVADEFTLTVQYRTLDTGDVEVRASADGVEVIATGEAQFRAAHVVVVGADTRVTPAAPYSALFTAKLRAPLAVICREMTWHDWSLHPKLRAIPSLAQALSTSEARVVAGLDYLVAYDDEEGWAELRWVADPPEAKPYLWAENAAFDLRLLEKLFGALLGTPLVSEGEDSLELKNKLVALLHGLLSGPTVEALSTAVAALAGVPIALEAGEVISINSTAPTPEIVVRGFSADRVYRYPGLLRPLVGVGDSVEKLELLVEHPLVRDWLSPDFVRLMRLNTSRALLRSEVEKFAAVHIQLPYGVTGIAAEDADDPRRLPAQIQAYLDKALGVWTGALKVFLSLLFPLRDELSMLDALDWEGTFSVLTTLTNARDPRYNDGRGFVYDGTLTYNEAEFEILRDRLEVEATNTGGAPLLVHIFGTDTTIPPAGTVTIPEPL